MFCLVKIHINGKFVNVKAIIDTGNFLKEPITKVPVIIVQKDALEEIVPDYILNNLNRIINGEDVNLEDYISKIKIIPFSSLGKENGILLGLKVDKVLIEREEKIVNIDKAIVGIYNGCLSKSGKYQALIGLDLLEQEEINEKIKVTM